MRSALVALLVSLALPLGVAAADDPVDVVASQIMCQCGCSYTLLACASAMQCDVSAQMRQLIQSKVAGGESSEQIVGYFVAKYGEKVLAAPTKQGFNLTAWVTPFLAILAGGALVYVVVRAWVGRQGAAEVAPAGTSVPPELAAYARRVERELAEL